MQTRARQPIEFPPAAPGTRLILSKPLPSPYTVAVHRRTLLSTIIAGPVLLACVIVSPPASGEDVDFPPTPLTPLADIHKLHRKEAAMELPVRVRGVVTLARSAGRLPFVIGNDESGVYVQPHEDAAIPPMLQPGDLVEVTGITGPGAYAPIIRFLHVERLGRAPLPTARPVTLSQLLTGRFDSRLVEVRGVVQNAVGFPDSGSTSLEVAGEFGRISVIAPNDRTPPESFIDAEVTVRGVCFPIFNERAQVAGARIELNGTDEIEITRPPVPDPWDAPLVAMDELQAFSPEGVSFHRQRIRATVTLVRPRAYLYVQNDTESMRVHLADETDVRPGDRIEAVGFARPGPRFVEWRHALVRKIGDGPVPKPVPTTPAAVLRPVSPLDDRTTGDFHGRLVTIAGRLEGLEDLENGEHRIFIECEGQILSGLLANASSGDAINRLRIGSTVEITGVCKVEYSEEWPTRGQARPVGMRLLLRDADDIVVIRAASWWTPARLRVALAVAGAILLAALPWLRSLRRQVGERTRELASETRARQHDEIEFQATLRERERVAADMHDTVEQALTGVSYQLAVADRLQDRDPERGREHLRLATQLLAQSREDVRRSVWNLRAQALDGRSLAEVLRDMAASLTAKHDTPVEVRVSGAETDLPDRIAGHLLLLAHESLTNAFKHADPDRVDIAVRFGDKGVELDITDDGRGFDPDCAPGMGDGHMGLQGMRERIKRLRGSLRIDSRPGKGTTISATVPVDPRQPVVPGPAGETAARPSSAP